jgi:hypothetical protein
MDRYVIDSHPPTAQLVADGIDWLVYEAVRTGTSQAAVLVPEVRAIPNLSGGVGRSLSTQDRTFFRDGFDVQIFAARTRPHTFNGPLLVVWANSAMMASAEHLEPPSICATSWEADGLAEWVRVWGATDPRTREHFPPEAAEPASVGAVRSLSFDMPGDVLHRSDKAQAVNALRALKLCDRNIDPPMIRALAVQHGWTYDAADRLYELAEKFAAGKAVQGGSKLTKTRAKEMVTRFETPDGHALLGGY